MQTQAIEQVSDRRLSAAICSIGELFAKGTFAPASVQRDYSWDIENCRRLFEDLERAFLQARPDHRTPRAVEDDASVDGEDDDPIGETETNTGAQGAGSDAFACAAEDVVDAFEGYFLGPVVISPSPSGELEVFDGLQRLATITVLACVARDLCSDAKLSSRIDRVIEDGRGAYRLRLGKDAAMAKEVQRRQATSRIKIVPDKPFREDDRIRAAARWFRAELRKPNWSDQRRAAFIEFICDQVDVAIVGVRSEQLARQVFETTNATGKALDAVDIAKGMLVDLVAQQHGADTAEAFAGRWRRLRDAMGERHFAAYLQAVEFLINRLPQSGDHLSRLVATVKKQYGGRLLEWFDRVEAHASAFQRTIHFPVDQKLRGVDAQLYLMSLLPWRDWRPVALHILMARGANLYTDLRDLQRACWRMVLVGFSASDRALVFRHALEDYDSGVPGAAVRRSNHGAGDRGGAFRFSTKHVGEMREALVEPFHDYLVRRALALWIEATQWGNFVPSHINRNATIEHVLPETPRRRSQWLIDFPVEDIRALRRQQIGNLCIVPAEINEDVLKNYDFTVKRPVLAGLAEFKTALDVGAHDGWTEMAVLQRTKKLRDHCLRQLGIRP